MSRVVAIPQLSPVAEPARDRGDPAWLRFALPIVVLLAASLRLWRLDRNGFGTEYYSAGVRSMMQSWHNFFFNAFDPAGFISLDKPPLAFWIQVASAKLYDLRPAEGPPRASSDGSRAAGIAAACSAAIAVTPSPAGRTPQRRRRHRC
jgi:hypothetical protein